MKVKCVLDAKGPQIFCISPDETVVNCIKIFNSRHIGALIIMSPDEQILGIVTERDVLRSIRENGCCINNLKVSQIMTDAKLLVTASSEDDITDVMGLMTSKKIRHVPIVDHGKLSGIMAITEVVRAVYENVKEEIIRIKTDRAKVSLAYLEQMVLEITNTLRAEKLKLGLAESCTGGMIATAFTDLPGVSDIFQGSIISYSNDAKHDTLGIKIQTIDEFGAVSEQVATEMVTGACKCLDADVAISVTGIAGPAGGSPEKPLGLVYIATSIKGKIAV
ncbi:MAG: nicotinamide-nucleotide amidohydrolase family protein, partial [Lentisphaeria bacterium]